MNATPRPGKGRKTTSVLIRTLLGLTLLAVVVIYLDPSEIFAALTTVERGPLIFAILTQVVAKLVWTYRWRAILRANQLERGAAGAGAGGTGAG